MKISKFSNIGFIFAAAGSAVGLGNIWKFPYITGEYGGGAFVLIYLIAIALVGISILIAEMSIGKLGGSDTVTSFENLAPTNKRLWSFAGFSAFTGLLILTFYNVVIGWILYYIFHISFSLPDNMIASEAIFTDFLHHNALLQIFYFTVVTFIIGYIVNRGIKSGIEKFNLFFFPLIVIIFIGMLIYAMSMDSFTQAVSFLFVPDFSKITTEALMMAVGHAFFTLSLGMGAIMTYSASLPKETNIAKTSLIVAFIDTAVALIAGLVLFTFLFEFGSSPAKGPGLVFISLPTIFAQLGFSGSVFALLFFLALAFAGLTSAVSLLEPSVLYIINRFKTTRLKAVIITISSLYSIGILVLLSSIEGYAQLLTFGGKSLFDTIDFISSAILLPIMGFVMAIFVAYILPKAEIKKLLETQMSSGLYTLWIISLKYITPLILIILLLKEIGVISFS